MLKNLSLSEKLSREVMYTRKKAFGLGLLEPNTALAIFTLKKNFRYMRMNSDTSNTTKVNK